MTYICSAFHECPKRDTCKHVCFERIEGTFFTDAHCGRGHWSGIGPDERGPLDNGDDPWWDCADYEDTRKETPDA